MKGESTPKKEWTSPSFTVYGDMTALTQQTGCDPQAPGCKPKVLGFGDDFASNISTV